MKVLLLDNVKKIGHKNDIVEVNDGYAINFLIKKGLAKKATSADINKMKQLKEKKLSQKEKEEQKNQEDYKRLNKQHFVLKAKGSEKGHLFASVHKKDIADLFLVDEKKIILNHDIKEIGEYEIEVALGKLTAKVNLKIELE